jgi:nitrite reductase/ring-hydroxylating ferredoxin subunit
MGKRIAMFATDDMVDGDCKTIQIPDGAYTKEIFVVFKNGDYFVYSNSCPHTGSPLDWMPDQFLNLDKTLIQCATHNALFRIEDGYCVSGPCAGQSLQQIPVEVVDSVVMIEIDEDGNPQ